MGSINPSALPSARIDSAILKTCWAIVNHGGLQVCPIGSRGVEHGEYHVPALRIQRASVLARTTAIRKNLRRGTGHRVRVINANLYVAERSGFRIETIARTIIVKAIVAIAVVFRRLASLTREEERSLARHIG